MRYLLCVFWFLTASFGLAQLSTSDKGQPNIRYSERLLLRARSGSPGDEFLLGFAYATGAGVHQDRVQALYWYRRAANHADDRASNELGRIYAQGDGVPRDYQQALAWFRRAASNGSRAGENNLATMYFQGLGVTPDPQAAVRLWKRAAE